jgi:hypothetical protein
VVVLVADLLAAPAPVVVGAKFEDIGHQVVTLNAQVFHNLPRISTLRSG